jgi:hypothetical protein
MFSLSSNPLPEGFALPHDSALRPLTLPKKHCRIVLPYAIVRAHDERISEVKGT